MSDRRIDRGASVTIRGLSKSYENGRIKAFRGIDLDIATAERSPDACAVEEAQGPLEGALAAVVEHDTQVVPGPKGLVGDGPIHQGLLCRRGELLSGEGLLEVLA